MASSRLWTAVLLVALVGLLCVEAADDTMLNKNMEDLEDEGHKPMSDKQIAALKLKKPIILNPLHRPDVADHLAKIAAVLAQEPSAAGPSKAAKQVSDIDLMASAEDMKLLSMNPDCAGDACKGRFREELPGRAPARVYRRQRRYRRDDRDYRRDDKDYRRDERDYAHRVAVPPQRQPAGPADMRFRAMAQTQAKVRVQAQTNNQAQAKTQTHAHVTAITQDATTTAAYAGPQEVADKIQKLEKLVKHAIKISELLPLKVHELAHLKMTQKHAVQAHARKEALKVLAEHQLLIRQMSEHIRTLKAKVTKLKQKRKQLKGSDNNLRKALKRIAKKQKKQKK